MLAQPGVGGMVCHAEVDDTTRAELDDDEDEHGAEEEVVGLEEVAGPDVTGVAGDEGGPGLFWGNATCAPFG